MDITIRPVTTDEIKYTYRQSQQLAMQCGATGHLRGDFGSTGQEFFTTWNDAGTPYKTDEFKAEFDAVINALRFDEEYGGILKDRTAMEIYGLAHPVSAFHGNCCTEYGFRADTESHTCLIRCNPDKGDYNFYVFPYVTKWLDSHLANAEKGIRFIDSHYNEQFRIRDGDSITITQPDGEKTNRICRYIDEYHTEIGTNLYHICQFAERMEQVGATYAPTGPKSGERKPVKPRQKEHER